MCLGVPGQIVAFHDETDQLATVSVAGVTRTINVTLVADDEPRVGDWVLIHVGFAMSIIDENEAEQALTALRLLGTPFDTEVDDIARSRIE